MTEEAYRKAYERLNKAQREAVDSIEGPVMVIAGPGTGKTQVLTLRIANILKQTDTPPDAILALTYTDAGAHAMRSRLAEFIGADAYRTRIHTFHSFAERVFAEYPFSFPDRVRASQLSDIEGRQLWEEILTECTLPHITNSKDPLHYLPTIKKLVETLKRENISPEEFASRSEEALKAFYASEDIYVTRGKNKGEMKKSAIKDETALKRTIEAASLYARYEELLRERLRYDFADMILSLVAALESDSALRASLQEEILYVLADEHQDTNRAQYRILELLTDFHPNPNLFVVGDERQAIYRFQGASSENFRALTSYAPETKIITLTENYRSKQSILDAAHTLIAKGPDMLEGEAVLTAALLEKGTKDDVVVHTFETLRDELRAVSKWIEEDIASGVHPGEIAVLFRANSMAPRIKHECIVRGIPHRVVGTTGVFSIPLMRLFVATLSAVLHKDNQSIATSMYAPWWGIPTEEVWRITVAAKEERIPFYEALAKSKEENARRMHALLSSFGSAAASENILQVIERIAYESGALQSFLKDVEAYTGYETLFATASALEERKKGGATLADFLSELSYREEHSLDIEVSTTAREGTVSLMTAHKAKGLEFEKVYVVGLTDKGWGAPSRASAFSGLRPEIYNAPVTEDAREHDERKLLYVAMTRAKHALSLSYAEIDPKGKAASESRFLSELSEDEVRAVREEAIQPSEKYTAREVSALYRRIPETLESRGFSVTALNNYLKEPWLYVFRNLFQIPSPKTLPLIFGSAVDAAITKILKADEVEGVSVEEARKIVEEEMRSAPLSHAELAHHLPRALAAVERFMAMLPQWHEKKVSAKVKLTMPRTLKDNREIAYSGEIDILLTHKDGTLEVVDVKTGGKRTVVEEVSGGDDAAYYRQLVSYALLLRENGYELPRVGTLLYVEPSNDAQEVYTKSFEISPEAVSEYEQLLNGTLEEISEGAFLSMECDREKTDKEQHICDLADTIRAEVSGEV